MVLQVRIVPNLRNFYTRMQAAYLISGLRSPVGKASKGAFRFLRPDVLATQVLKGLLLQFPQIESQEIDDLIVGNAVPEAEQGMQMGRMIALQALGVQVPGFLVNRYCGSGLEAIAIAAARISTGQAQCILAGGTESMSLVPTTGVKMALEYGLSLDHPDYYLSMGLTAEEVAIKYNISREAQDEFAYQSHQKAISAQEKKVYAKEILPVIIESVELNESGKRVVNTYQISQDEGPRADTSVEVLAKLKPVFSAKGSVTAGNASQTSDGAAFVMVASEAFVKKHNLTPMARFCGYSVAGVEPSIMGMGPVKAVPKVLSQTGLNLSDIGLIELNEAFASQSIAVINELNLDSNITNIHGGAIAIGHPLACTGARLTLHLMHQLKEKSSRYGLITACVGGGQGVAGIIESLK